MGVENVNDSFCVLFLFLLLEFWEVLRLFEFIIFELYFLGEVSFGVVSFLGFSRVY